MIRRRRRVRQAFGLVLLCGGVLALLGNAAAALLGRREFEPLWAFLACAVAMAGAALRQAATDPAAEGAGGPAPAPMPPPEGDGTGGGDAGALGSEPDAGGGDGAGDGGPE